jgi:hypothetical protein
MKTSHLEVRIALRAVEMAQGYGEYTQREPATFDFDIGSAWLISSADCARTGPQPGDGGLVSCDWPRSKPAISTPAQWRVGKVFVSRGSRRMKRRCQPG